MVVLVVVDGTGRVWEYPCAYLVSTNSSRKLDESDAGQGTGKYTGRGATMHVCLYAVRYMMI